jgi:hypothetical protein
MLWSSEGSHLLDATITEEGNYRYLAENIPDAHIEPLKEDASRPVWCLKICSYDPGNDKYAMALPGAEDVIHGKKACFVIPGMPKGLILETNDGLIFTRVGLFSFRDPENFPLEPTEREDPSFIARVKAEKESFFNGCEPRDITII